MVQVQDPNNPGTTLQYISASDLAAAQNQQTTTTQMYKCPMCDHMEFLESSIVAHIKQDHVVHEEQVGYRVEIEKSVLFHFLTIL